MQAAEFPPNESERLHALRELRLLDTAPEWRFDQIVQLARRLTSCPIGLLSLVDERRVFLKSRTGIERAGLVIDQPHRDYWFCSHVVATGAPVVVEDAREDVRFSDHPLVRVAPGARTYVGVPVRTPGGQIAGALAVIDVEPRQVTDIEINALKELSKLVEAELSSLQHATTDQLTGVSNARMFERVGNRLIEFTDTRRQPSCVLRADFAGIGFVNKAYGFDIGDRALIDAANVLRATVRGSDLLARVGPDEFAVLLIAAGLESVPIVLGRLAESVRAHNDTSAAPYSVSFGFGYVEHRIGDGRDIAALLKDATLMMGEGRRNPGQS